MGTNIVRQPRPIYIYIYIAVDNQNMFQTNRGDTIFREVCRANSRGFHNEHLLRC